MFFLYIKDVIPEYILDCKIRNLTEATVLQKQIQLNNFLNYLKDIQNIVKLEEVTKITARQWIVYKLETNRKARTINTQIKIIRSFFNYCVDENYIKKNPFELVKLLKQETPKFAVFNDLEVKRLIEHFTFNSYKNARNKVMISLMADAGLRVSEVMNLEMKDVDDESVRVLGKGRKWRVIPISHQLRKMMLKYERIRSEYIADYPSDYYFITQFKGKYEKSMPIQKMVKDASKAVKVRKVVRASPHTLRHYYALKSLELGTPIQQLSKNLGHTSIKTTEIYLSQITNEQLEKQALQQSISPLSIL